MTAPFGALRPTPFQQKVREAANLLPDNYFGRKAASLLLGPAGGRAKRSYDVEIFGGVRTRLHPYDNICEKRVYLTPQHWDGEERAFLAALIALHDRPEFLFADIGANAGLYTLFAWQECKLRGHLFRGAAVEPDTEMQDRFTFNMEASGAAGEVQLFRCAASNVDGVVNFSINEESRGMSCVHGEASGKTRARTLQSIFDEAGFPQIDVMKIDIEGHETSALEPLFRRAPRTLHPRWILLEISHDREGRSAEELVLRAGYRVTLKTRLNAVLERIA